uniref:[RNA-polymerase]-subunit kinase n=2 Tax=Kalmanozyma brasiliensis (strain GHG001) TaxID=1365824 RepID=V5EV01_KALBG
MDSEKDGFPVTAMREIKLLQALRHENVVRLHEMMVTRGSIYMVFEYMEHDLNGILAHPAVQFSPAHLKSLAGQLFEGLDYLHRRSVLHRDLKGSNILLNNEGRLKLADFGLARFYAKRRRGDYTNRVVTLWYRPPELLFGETQYGSEVDMWGAGCIFVELFVKKPVFQSETELGQVQAITDVLGPVRKEDWPEVDKLAWYEMVKPATLADAGEQEQRDHVQGAFAKYLPVEALEVARGLLTYDPRKRWSAKEALASRYFEQEPKAELPAGLLSALEGEWHEYESRRAKKKATGQRGTDTATVATAGSTDPVVTRSAVDDQQQG